MKVWLNDLKEGDIFYHIILNNVCKCKHLGDAHNMNFKMSRIKFAIIEHGDMIITLGGEIHEAFVNQYVYDNYEEAEAQLYDDYKNELNDIKNKIMSYKILLKELEERKTLLINEINEYDKRNIKEDI
jgi:hypothetical protein